MKANRVQGAHCTSRNTARMRMAAVPRACVVFPGETGQAGDEICQRWCLRTGRVAVNVPARVAGTQEPHRVSASQQCRQTFASPPSPTYPPSHTARQKALVIESCRPIKVESSGWAGGSCKQMRLPQGDGWVASSSEGGWSESSAHLLTKPVRALPWAAIFALNFSTPASAGAPGQVRGL